MRVDGGERLVRLEERVNYLRENSATKTDIVALNGRLDVILEKIGNQPTRADLATGRKWIIGTAIALVGLALAAAKLFF